MKCYYEVLNVSNDCECDEIKKSYRKLALIWHPDKNLDNTEEAKQQFQLIQEAYDVLIDPHERSWYDRNRELILAQGSGEENKCNIYDVYPYFRASCYKGFEDDDKGFYSVYRKVFNIIAAKELESEDVPTFGSSKTSFEDVQKFYSYWNCFCTRETFYWLNPYDIRQATNKRIFKYMEKDNKKIRDEAKKERNELVRNLVRYVSKRDKRLLAYSEILKQRIKENTIKAEKHRKQMIEKHKQMVASCKESEWSKFSNFEKELNDIESSTIEQFNESENNYNEQVDELFCIACNKYFKNAKSFENHENSKKHRESIIILKQHMEEEEMVNIIAQQNIEDKNIDEASDNETNGIESDNSLEEIIVEDVDEPKKKTKRNKKKENLTLEDSSSLDFGISKKQKKKLQRMKIEVENVILNKKIEENNMDNDCDIIQNDSIEITKEDNMKNGDIDANKEDEIETKKKKDKNKKKFNNTEESIDTSHTCAKCKQKFRSKNKLFTHLKDSGHSVYLPSSANSCKKTSKSKKSY